MSLGRKRARGEIFEEEEDDSDSEEAKYVNAWKREMNRWRTEDVQKTEETIDRYEARLKGIDAQRARKVLMKKKSKSHSDDGDTSDSDSDSDAESLSSLEDAEMKAHAEWARNLEEYKRLNGSRNHFAGPPLSTCHRSEILPCRAYIMGHRIMGERAGTPGQRRRKKVEQIDDDDEDDEDCEGLNDEGNHGDGADHEDSDEEGDNSEGPDHDDAKGVGDGESAEEMNDEVFNGEEEHQSNTKTDKSSATKRRKTTRKKTRAHGCIASVAHLAAERKEILIRLRNMGLNTADIYFKIRESLETNRRWSGFGISSAPHQLMTLNGERSRANGRIGGF
ncbi:hypothetical protein K469DRAFT_690823 [Zopfia rhizophila CBS 207.26]|uniref:Uncharacterized protein n=1 Tax=Zopfia rhizophila CBS 207.26 TaxID=1314779 RepID=A0A6A6DRU7_9PEZI|nr:hypothetical protein K469DRAFT_690823 [Zopfia rhizophila CBS 207.26]